MCFHICFSNFCFSSLIWYQYFVIRNVILPSQCVIYARITTTYIPIIFGACFTSGFCITIQNWENFPLQFEIKGRHCFHIVCIFLYSLVYDPWWDFHSIGIVMEKSLVKSTPNLLFGPTGNVDIGLPSMEMRQSHSHRDTVWIYPNRTMDVFA